MPRETLQGSSTEAEILSARFLEEFASEEPRGVIIRWDEDGNLKTILPEVIALKGVAQRPDYHLEGDVWTHTLRVLGHLPAGASLDLRLAALFHDVGKPETTGIRPDGRIDSHDHQAVGARMAEKIIERFRTYCPGIEINGPKIIWLVHFHLVGQGSSGDVLRNANIDRYFLRPDGWGDDLLALIIADSLGRDTVRGDKLATVDATIARIAARRAEKVREQTPPPPLPDGNEIMRLFELGPSPAVRQIKEALVGIHRRLGFTEKDTGMKVAGFLRDRLVLGPGAKTIPSKDLEAAVQATVRHFLKEQSRLHLGQETLLILTNKEELPWLKKEVLGKQREFQLHRSEARFLEGGQVRIFVLGPPRSGKTSFVYSLTRNLRELCQDLPFRLEIEAVDLDKSRADLSRWMRAGRFFPKKLRWTEPLAQQAREDFRPRRSNIVLGDGPGGTPDQITQTISGPANCAILIVSGENDRLYLERREGYLTFLRSQKTPVVAEFRTRPRGQRKESGEEIASELRALRPREFLGGQIVGLEFGQENMDPAIRDVAKALLFNLLPGLVRGRRGK